MIIPALQRILDRIDTWPEEQQEKAARLLFLLERSEPGCDWDADEQDLALVDELIARSASPSASLLALRADVQARLRPSPHA